MTDRLMAPRNAAEWFLEIHAAQDPSRDTLQAWSRWLDASEENRQAFEEIVQIWHRTPSAVMARPTEPASGEEYDGSVSVAEWRARQTHQRSLFKTMRRPVFAIAAALIFAALGLASYRVFLLAPVVRGEFVTRTGEHRQLELEDGSRVVLGAHSRLTVDLKPASRELRLDAGEAYFSVAKDAARPFIVQALNGRITAVGTAFNVKAVEDRVTVTVTEGSVNVASARASNRLLQGEQLTYEQTAGRHVVVAPRIESVESRESARWREGWLVYRDEPLKYVIADISRYTELQIEVAEPAANLQFSGAVFRGDIDEWIAALSEVAAVSVERAGTGYVIR